MSSESSNHSTDSRTGWWFFPCVISAGLLYAGVTLSPRVVALDEFKRDYHNRQLSLLKLEAEVLHQEKINRELRRNPEFAQWVSLHDENGSAKIGEPNSIPLDVELQHDGLAGGQAEVTPRASQFNSPNHVHIARLFQSDPLVGRIGMLLAGVLVVDRISASWIGEKRRRANDPEEENGITSGDIGSLLDPGYSSFFSSSSRIFLATCWASFPDPSFVKCTFFGRWMSSKCLHGVRVQIVDRNLMRLP